jgi:uncharacterized membrane protein YbhN (UPF0104 family)
VAGSPCFGEILPSVGKGAGEYATGVSDLTRSPWLRAALLVLAAGLAVYGLASQWTQVQAALAKLDGWDVAGAAVCAIAGLGCMMLAWRALLADLGSPLPLPDRPARLA